jgi:FixJ family two-component response regulator
MLGWRRTGSTAPGQDHFRAFHGFLARWSAAGHASELTQFHPFSRHFTWPRFSLTARFAAGPNRRRQACVEDLDLCAKLLLEPFGQTYAAGLGVPAACLLAGARAAAPQYRATGKPAAAPAVAPRLPPADVAIVDGDAALRDQLCALLFSIGLRAVPFAEPEGLLAQGAAASVRCLLTDVRLRGFGGLELQARLLAQKVQTPIIFMTAHGDIKMSVLAMKAGAVDFLTKPLREQDVLDAVMAALERDRQQREDTQQRAALKARVASLTPRETGVLALVTAGLMNKQIAARLDLSEVTVKMHRANLMRKMGARSLAELTRMAAAWDWSAAPV